MRESLLRLKFISYRLIIETTAHILYRFVKTGPVCKNVAGSIEIAGAIGGQDMKHLVTVHLTRPHLFTSSLELVVSDEEFG